MAYAEKRGKGPRPWRVKYKVPGGEASESGFETKQAALVWGRDQEAKVRAGTWNDPAAGEITVSEWIERWKATQDVGLSTTENREYLIGRFIRPYWGVRQLNSLTGEQITVWENGLPAAAGVSRRTARDARSLLHTILGDAASARPPPIPFNPAVRPRNRGRRTGRRLDRSPQRAGDAAGGTARGRTGGAAEWPGRRVHHARRDRLHRDAMGGDDRPRAGLRPTYADQRRVAAPRDQWPFLPAPAEGRLVPKHELGAARAGRPSYLPGRAADRTGSKAHPAAMRLCPRARRHRPVHVLQPGGRPLPAQQLRAASVPPCLGRAVRAGEWQARQPGRGGRHSVAGQALAAAGRRRYPGSHSLPRPAAAYRIW